MRIEVNSTEPARVEIALDGYSRGNRLHVEVTRYDGASCVGVSVAWEEPGKVTGTRDEVRDRSRRILFERPLDLLEGASPLDVALGKDELEALLWAVRQAPLEKLNRFKTPGEVGYGALSRAANKVERLLSARINPRRGER